MDLMEKYLKELSTTLESIKKERINIIRAADLMAETIRNGGLVHVFGTDAHAAMVGEEMFFRNGGLIQVNPIFDPGISLYHGAYRSSILEKLEGLARPILQYYENIRKDDVMIIINPYGINAVSIDAAIESRRMGLKVIAITSPGLSRTVSGNNELRHPSGKSLSELEEVDIVIDSGISEGECILKLKSSSEKSGCISTICNTVIANLLTAYTVERLAEKDFGPRTWYSKYDIEKNKQNLENIYKYIHKIKHL